MTATITKFPEPIPPGLPKPFRPAGTAPMVIEKRLEVISFRAPDGTRAYVQRRADDLGISPSSYCLSLIDRDRQEQAESGQQSKHGGLSEAVSELSRETAIALEDGRIDAHERIRITRPASWILAWLWPRRMS